MRKLTVAACLFTLASAWPAQAQSSAVAPAGAGQPPSVQAQPAESSMDSGWPTWLKLNFVERGRLESWRGTSPEDTYYLNRIRLQAEVRPAAWLRGVVQFQDARVAGYALPVKPASMFNELDLRQAFVDITPPGSGVVVRPGRQELAFGDGRLVAPSDWGNVTRTFDGLSVALSRARWTVTLFATQPVIIDPTRFDERQRGDWFSGAYLGLTTRSRRAWDAYVLVKAQDRAVDERGRRGDLRVATFGLRAAGPLPSRFDYTLEGAIQRGHVAQAPLEAWAAHVTLARTLSTAGWRPRVAFDYDAASGDKSRLDGKAGTFDALYPSNHARWGLTDRVSWRNMEHVGLTLGVTPRRDTRVSGGWHRLWVREQADGYYNGAGTRVPPTGPASGRRLGDAIDAQVTIDVTKYVSVNAGVGRFLVGPFLREANRQRDQWLRFVMWRVAF